MSAPYAIKHCGEIRVVALRGHVQRRSPIRSVRRCQCGAAIQQLCDLGHLPLVDGGQQPSQIRVIGLDPLRLGTASHIGRHDRVKLIAQLFHVGLQFSPTGKAELTGDGKLRVTEFGVRIFSAKCVETIFALLLEPLEIGAERKRAGHRETFFPGARRPRVTGRKKDRWSIC